jgi:F-type H+-transporting ATPase subunit epsilon
MYRLSIVTPEKVFYEDEVESMTAPGMEGYLGILTDHAPLMTAIVPGKVTIRDSARKEIVMAVSHGFLEVSFNQATMLVDSVEYSSKIDAERARQALERARQRLADAAGEIDLPRARKAMERALNRLRIYRDQT